MSETTFPTRKQAQVQKPPQEQSAPASAQPAQTQPKIEIPERPALAENIELKGQMQESAFKDPPWLIDRGGGYLQVSSLLYHIAEQVDGQRNLEEIAQAASEATERQISVENVKQLLAKLMQLGVVVNPDAPQQVPAPRQASPLGVNMKVARIDPRYIDPLTNLLKVFFWPPVLIVMLIAAGAIEAWMFLSHGVGGGIHNALYTPGMMLAVFLLVFVATIFHEFGHATALHYGGGKVRGMGAGLYIVYPALYTDVTDNYRLPRWARVRTDLGGIYFNLIFSIALMGIYALTSLEFILLVVLVINLEIIHNLLPFLRLDGYWTLADITGIPDFFSQMMPFVRSIAPKGLPIAEGRKLPELKTWAKALFLLYIVVAVPFLLFGLFMMVRALPRIMATFVDALVKQTAIFADALGKGDVLMLLATLTQMIMLALPTLGLVYTLYTLGKGLFVKAKSWSDGSPLRRTIAAMGGVGLAALLVYLWAPQVPVVNQPGPLYEYTRQNFVPISPSERFTLPEVVSGAVLTTTGSFTNTFGASTSITATTTAPITATVSAPITATATIAPTTAPTQAAAPTNTPTVVPTTAPTLAPTMAPTNTPNPEPPAATPTPTPVPPTATTVPPTPTAVPPSATPLPPTATSTPQGANTPAPTSTP